MYGHGTLRHPLPPSIEYPVNECPPRREAQQSLPPEELFVEREQLENRLVKVAKQHNGQLTAVGVAAS